jgi:L-threonylcarbamoyladenylate synthase
VTQPAIIEAVRALQAGEVVAFPTETVYGLGADAGRADAVEKIFTLKGRPPDHPLIVHVADASDAEYWVRAIPASARTLMSKFWPGPLTLILQRAAHVLDVVTGSQATIGVRCPRQPVALALLRACRESGIRGLAAPSANRFGHVSPTTAAHVRSEFGDGLMILDDGACDVGIESTIVDLTAAQPRILRPGMIAEAEIAEALQTSLSQPGADAPRVSGSLAAHYAPRTRLDIVAPAEIANHTRELVAAGLQVIAMLRTAPAPSGAQTVIMPATVTDYARQLYASLREADLIGADRIIVEATPDDREWQAVVDRLQRAAVGAGRSD